jgi:hypothetical protein
MNNASVWPETAERGFRLFRYGFLCKEAGTGLADGFAEEAEARGWRCRVWPGIELWTCPELDVAVFGTGARRLIQLGEAHSCGDMTTPAVMTGLAAADGDRFVELLDALSGRFALILAGAGGFEIYNDPCGSRSVYYLFTPGLVAGSHAMLLGKACERRPMQAMQRLLKTDDFTRRGVRYLPGDATMFDGVLALIPNHCLDSVSKGLRRYWPRSRLGSGSMDEFLELGLDLLPAIGRQVAARRRPVLGVTAGVDSRTLIAAYKAAGIGFETMNWSYRKDAAREEAIVAEISALSGARHQNILPEDDRDDPVTWVAGQNSGGFRGRSRVARGMLDAYGTGDDTVFVRGWGAEVMKGYYQHGFVQLSDLTLDDMCAAYSQGLRGAGPAARYRETVEAAFAGYLERGAFGGLTGLGYDPNDIFYIEHRMAMWCGSVMNEVDAAMPTFVGFNARQLYLAAWRLPREARLTPQLLLRLCARFDPAIAAVATAPVRRRWLPGRMKKAAARLARD